MKIFGIDFERFDLRYDINFIECYIVGNIPEPGDFLYRKTYKFDKSDIDAIIRDKKLRKILNGKKEKRVL